jgi:hypothetical protein
VPVSEWSSICSEALADREPELYGLQLAARCGEEVVDIVAVRAGQNKKCSTNRPISVQQLPLLYRIQDVIQVLLKRHLNFAMK